MMLEEGAMQAAWGGNTDTYTNTLCLPQLREHCRSKEDKPGGQGGVLGEGYLLEVARVQHS